MPLSDLGYLGYKSYWQSVLSDIFHNNKASVFSVAELSALTSIRQEDIIATICGMGLFECWSSDNSVVVSASVLENFVLKKPRCLNVSCIIQGELYKKEFN